MKLEKLAMVGGLLGLVAGGVLASSLLVNLANSSVPAKPELSSVSVDAPITLPSPKPQEVTAHTVSGPGTEPTAVVPVSVTEESVVAEPTVTAEAGKQTNGKAGQASSTSSVNNSAKYSAGSDYGDYDEEDYEADHEESEDPDEEGE